MARDDDQMLDLPPIFGSGVIGTCDICGTRQAVIVLSKERYKLCVLDFLNKTWIKSDKKPGAPLPLYRSERVWYPTDSTRSGKAQGILLTPTKQVRHPGVLVTPDVYGITTTVLDGAIRLAREGIEVFVPDVAKTDGIGPAHLVSLRTGVTVRGGIPTSARRVSELVDLYADALTFLRGREMVDAARTALLGMSYGGSLALALAARDTRLAGVVVAYPMPVHPAGLTALVSAPLLYVGGARDRASEKARRQIDAARPATKGPVQFSVLPGVGHNFLARDLRAYDLRAAEAAWAQVVQFLKKQLFPPPPTPPTAPPKPVAAAAAAPAKPPTAASSSPSPAAPPVGGAPVPAKSPVPPPAAG
ncbi:MAG TPA: dienelactone hydrolase family protein [Thermoplasmata archaeon]|nr:dienelactone hydrolase family protein [Thermoplasmata archaeon]